MPQAAAAAAAAVATSAMLRFARQVLQQQQRLTHFACVTRTAAAAKVEETCGWQWEANLPPLRFHAPAQRAESQSPAHVCLSATQLRQCQVKIAKCEPIYRQNNNNNDNSNNSNKQGKLCNKQITNEHIVCGACAAFLAH